MLNIGLPSFYIKRVPGDRPDGHLIGREHLPVFFEEPEGPPGKVDISRGRGGFEERVMAKNNFALFCACGAFTLNACSVGQENQGSLRCSYWRMTLCAWNSSRAIYIISIRGATPDGRGGGHPADCLCSERGSDPVQTTTVLLESMAGSGSEIGKDFGELARIIDGVELNKMKVGVCLDTCHIFGAGYDIANDLDGVLREFDRTVGLSRLKRYISTTACFRSAVHRDRHQQIGKGTIGFPAFTRIINHPALRRLPFYLETPGDLASWKRR
jgi:hypothetical protein